MRLSRTLCLALGVVAVACRAQAPPVAGTPCREDCQTARLIKRAWQPAVGYPEGFAPTEAAATKTPIRATRPEPAVIDWKPPDNHWVTRLKSMRDLPLLTLWKTETGRLFLGINEDGVAGLAFRGRRAQRSRANKRRATTAEAWREQRRLGR